MLHAGRARLDTTTALQLVTATAAAAASGHSDTASEVAAYRARMQLLRVALHQSATAVVSSSAAGSGARVDTGEKLLWPCLGHATCAQGSTCQSWPSSQCRAQCLLACVYMVKYQIGWDQTRLGPLLEA